jgi:hypothetical protein
MSNKVEIVKVSKSVNGINYETTSIDSYFGLNGSGESSGAAKGEKALTHSFVMDTLRKVMGGVLTVIDASIHEEKQNKALKDLIRRIISDEMEFATNFSFDQKEFQKFVDEIPDSELNKLEPISIEEALGVE